MAMSDVHRREVFSAREIARAAGVHDAAVARLIADGTITSVDGEFVAFDEARHAAARLRAGERFPQTAAVWSGTPGVLFARHHATRRSPGLPAAASAAIHGVMLGGLLIAALAQVGSSEARELEVQKVEEPMRLVFLALPGPGGGGGGGGMRMPTPAPRARREGPSTLSSPIPERRPVAPDPPPTPQPPPPVPAEWLPPVEAPVATRAADEDTQAGVLEESPAEAPSRGAGEGGGAGTGTGVGLGEGDGSGIGDGSGGGEGGGVYGPGSGVQPPRLLSEVKPDYTEEARRRGVEGEVVMEIVVRRDGSVGDVRILQGLGSGLDQQAASAVRRWKFAPATRRGTPVDVTVEVAVEFKLR
jgi:periplasmic protein TonB